MSKLYPESDGEARSPRPSYCALTWILLSRHSWLKYWIWCPTSINCLSKIHPKNL